MHQITDYSELLEPERSRAALEDIKGYLGDEHFKRAEGIFRDNAPLDFASFAFNCSVFLGIEGYPVRVWYEALFGKKALN